MVDWTEKYRPTTLSEVRGNNKSRDELREWAESWDDHGRAAIVHGSPGVGKTSAAHALANDMDWDVVEVNASDRRRTDEIERYVGRASQNSTLGGADGRQLIVVDEADSFHGNVDRGGTRALSQVVRDAGQPIVLIANDFYEMSRGLRNACEEIEFRDVSRRSIVPVLRDVCRREDVEYDEDALDRLAEKNAGDLRSAINDLQALAETDHTLRADDVVTGDRDRSKDIFAFLDAVLKAGSAQDALYTSYDVDETPDDLVQWVEDKVPKVYEGDEIARAYDALANADRWLGRVRATQNYSYWRYANDNLSAGVAAARDEDRGGWIQYGGAPYRSSKDATRDYVARQIATHSDVSVATARRHVLPYLAAMTHHCRNRELTVAMTARFDLDADHVAYVTGSGENTNKVQGIVEDAAESRESAAVEHSGGAFAGTADGGDDPDSDGDGGADGSLDAFADGDDGEVAADGDDADADAAGSADGDDDQSGLGDFM